jgi:hypothetical protein
MQPVRDPTSSRKESVNELVKQFGEGGGFTAAHVAQGVRPEGADGYKV